MGEASVGVVLAAACSAGLGRTKTLTYHSRRVGKCPKLEGRWYGPKMLIKSPARVMARPVISIQEAIFSFVFKERKKKSSKDAMDIGNK
jgi:hypothetical protein